MQNEIPYEELSLNDRTMIDKLLNNKYNHLLFEEYVSTIPENFQQELHQMFDNSVTILLKYQNFKRIYIFLQGKWIDNAIKNQKITLNTEIGIEGQLMQGNIINTPMILYLIVNDNENNYNFIIYNPKETLSITAVSYYIECERRLFLKNKYSSIDQVSNINRTKGCISHNIFEKILMRRDEINENDLKEFIIQQIIDYYHQLNNLEEMFEELLNYFYDIVNKTKQFKQKYIIEQTPIFDLPNWAKMILTDVSFSELSFNSLKYGLKGRVDLVLKARFFRDASSHQFVEVFVPFELKTGQIIYPDFHIQVLLYNFCFFDNFIANSYSLLFYTTDSAIKLVKNDIGMLKASLRNRNNITLILTQTQIPQINQDDYFCRFCSEIKNCVFEHFSNNIRIPNIDDLEDLIMENNFLARKSRELFVQNYKYRSIVKINTEMTKLQQEENFKNQKNNDFIKTFYRDDSSFHFSTLYSLIDQFASLNNIIYYFYLNFDLYLPTTFNNETKISKLLLIKKKLCLNIKAISILKLKAK